eukprot:365983-Chlamydomonas_euryale.AAC.12
MMGMPGSTDHSAHANLRTSTRSAQLTTRQPSHGLPADRYPDDRKRDLLSINSWTDGQTARTERQMDNKRTQHPSQTHRLLGHRVGAPTAPQNSFRSGGHASRSGAPTSHTATAASAPADTNRCPARKARYVTGASWPRMTCNGTSVRRISNKYAHRSAEATATRCSSSGLNSALSNGVRAPAGVPGAGGGRSTATSVASPFPAHRRAVPSSDAEITMLGDKCECLTDRTRRPPCASTSAMWWPLAGESWWSTPS